jgi:NAD dependent epimerase/dehydratase
MKALVTGAEGFIGSHLTEYLLSRGYEVRALYQYNSFNSYGWLEGITQNDNLEIIGGDIRDTVFCEELTKDIDVVFHLAALIAIPYSYVAPQSYIDTNVHGTMNICNAALKNGCSRVIHTSTSEVYGTAQYVPIDELHPKVAQSPYSASKIGADAVAMSYYYSFDLPLTIVRPFNTYGPRQSARAFIPSVIIQMLDGVKEISVGDLSPTRDFNYVLDTALGFELVSKCEELIGEEVNIASRTEISMEATLNLIKSIIGSDVNFVVDQNRIRPASSEVFRLFGDASKAGKMAGYKPEFSLEDGLTATIDWFKKSTNRSGYKSGVYNV